MSSGTWTPAAVTSNQEFCNEIVYRFMAADAAFATLEVTDTKDEAELVEQLVSDSVARPSTEVPGLHHLLEKPFVTKPHRNGSRFGSLGSTGVFYAGFASETAAAERGFYVRKLLVDSPELPSVTQQQVRLTAQIKSPIIDIRVAPFHTYNKIFMDKNSYEKTQEFADVVRKTSVYGIKYASVRSPRNEPCLALLSPRGFAKKIPNSIEGNWTCFATADRVTWINLYGGTSGTPIQYDFSY